MAKYVFAAKDGSGDITDSTGKVIEFTKLEDAEAWAEKNGVDPAEFDIDQLSTTTPEQIKARGEEAYKKMMSDIATQQERQQVEDLYGYTKNPVVGTMYSLVAPSSMESIRQGKMPNVADIGIDIGLAATSLGIAPLKGATTLGTIGKNALLGTGIAGAGEGAMALAHDRQYNLMAPVIGGVGGSVVGGLAGLRNAQLTKVVPEDMVPYVTSNLGLTQAKTVKNLHKGVPSSIKELGVTPIPNTSSIVMSGDIPYTIMDEVANKVEKNIKRKRTMGDMSYEDAVTKRKILSDAMSSMLDIASGTPRNNIPFTTTLAEAERLYKADPEIGMAMMDVLKPYITRQEETAARYIGKLPKKPTTVTSYLPPIENASSKRFDELFNKLQTASAYTEQAPTMYKLQRPTGIVDALTGTSQTISPETVQNVIDVTSGVPIRTALAYPQVTSETKVKPSHEKSKQAYTQEGELLYAPRGRITWEQLFSEAPRSK